MDKQRLMELAGVTEASHIGSSGQSWIVAFINHSDVDQIEYVWGPFSSRTEGYEFVRAVMDAGWLQEDTPDWSDPINQDWFEVKLMEDPRTGLSSK